jgi:peptide/nickel transport system permease protein
VASWLSATAVALLLGTSLGLAAAVGPRLVGLTLSRSVELAGAAPSIVVTAILVERLAQHPTVTFVATVAILRSIDVACVIREKSAEVATTDFVRAARASGASPFRIVRRHLAPHVAGGAAASALLTGPALLGLEAAMVYLGVAQPFPASWTRPLATPDAASPHAVLVAILSIGCLMAASYVLARAVDVTSALRPAATVGNRVADD